jgi:peptidylprolyl isomerase
MKQFIIGLVVVLVLIGVGIALMTGDTPTTDTATDTNATTTTQGTTATTTATTTLLAVTNTQGTMQATITTNKGVITLELFGDQTPNTAGNFAKLAQEGFYNSTKFHRVIEGFMIQGGDPLTKDDTKQALWGTGDPGYKFADEIVPALSNVTGTISMANSGPNTNGSQFFINVADNTFLDGKHAVFGKVTGGMDIVMAIASADKNQRDVPTDPIILESVVITQ